MRRLKVTMLGLFAVFALASAFAASASATTMTLPEFLTRTTFTGTSGAGKLAASGLEINCKTGTNKGALEAGTNRLGTFQITFNTCKSNILSAECKSEGDAKEVILTEGSFHLVLETLSGTDRHYILFLVSPLVVNCLGVKMNVKGTLLGEITPANVLTTHYVLKVAVVGGRQELTSYENDNGTLIATQLLANEKEATEESAENKLTTVADTLIVN